MYILPIAIYGFQLWFFKGSCMANNVKELNKMQQRAALWITGVFKTFLSTGIKAIVGLILILLYFRKLNGYYYLWYTSVPYNYAINLLLDPQHAKNVSSHRFSLPNLTDKQRTKLNSPASNINNHLSEVTNSFILFYSIFSPSSRLVDHFSNHIIFHSPLLSDDKDLKNTSKTSITSFVSLNSPSIPLLLYLMVVSKNPMLQPSLCTSEKTIISSIKSKSNWWISHLSKLN